MKPKHSLNYYTMISSKVGRKRKKRKPILKPIYPFEYDNYGAAWKNSEGERTNG